MSVIPVPGTSGASPAATVSTVGGSAPSSTQGSASLAPAVPVQVGNQSGSAAGTAAAGSAALQQRQLQSGVSTTISMRAYQKQLEDVQEQIARIRTDASLTDEQRSIQLTSLDARQALIETSISQVREASRELA